MASGVAHALVAYELSVLKPPQRVVFAFGCVPATEASGVGHRKDEHASPEVRRADFGDAEHVPLRIEPELGQVAEYNVEPASSESCDVLHEDVARSHLANDSRELAPEAGALSADAGALASIGDVLTREAASDEIHCSTPASAVERSHVAPDRSRIQSAFLHARRQYRASVGFPLHVADDASRSGSKSDPEVESTAAREERQHSEGRIIHI